MNRHAQPPASPFVAPVFALGMGLLGALVNLMPLPIGAGNNLVLGNCAYLLVAAWLRPRHALLAALLVAVPLSFSWGHAGPLFVFSGEAMVVAALRAGGMRLFYAVMLYWLLVGMPLTAVLIRVLGTSPTDYLLAICVKQGFNGALYGSLAAMLVLAIGTRASPVLHYRERGARRSLRSRLVYVMTVITSLSMASTTLLTTRTTVRYQEGLVRASLEGTATHLARRTGDYVATHRRSIALLAELLGMSDQRAELLQPLLEEVHRNNPGFLSLLGLDAAGRIVAASPVERLRAAEAGVFPSTTDRSYFSEAIASEQTYESDVFLSRGVFVEPVIAISRRFRAGRDGAVAGVVQGSLNLRELAQVVEPPGADQSLQVVLVDRSGRLIHASPALGFTPLEDLAKYARAPSDTERGVLAFDVGGSTLEYLDASVVLDNGWRIYALMEYRTLVRELTLQYGFIFVLSGFAIALAAWLALRAGQRLAAPLEQVARELVAIKQGGTARLGPLRAEASAEIALVHEELAYSFAQVERHKGELEGQVAARTRELEEANRKLQELAGVDALTGIANRRTLGERFPVLRATVRRAGSRLAVVVVDLDHFKRLNDTRGHLAGDRVLVEIGRLLHESFARETDVVARFGGEEFVIALACEGAASLSARLESLRARIANTRVAIGDGEPVSVTASFGAVVAHGDYSALLSEWLAAADRCLYQAKEQGRDRVIIEAHETTAARRPVPLPDPGTHS